MASLICWTERSASVMFGSVAGFLASAFLVAFLVETAQSAGSLSVSPSALGSLLDVRLGCGLVLGPPVGGYGVGEVGLIADGE